MESSLWHSSAHVRSMSAMALLVFCIFSPLGLAAESAEQPASKNNKHKPAGANLIGSGLRLMFQGNPGQSYCIVTDPCLHINALMAAGAGNRAWVRGFGIRAGEHKLTILASTDPDKPLPIISLDGQVVRAPLKSALGVSTDDEGLKIQRWGQGKAFLVSVRRCGVRLLVAVKKAGQDGARIASLDVLDWNKLHSPHGIIGQIFPNRAKPEAFMNDGDTMHESTGDEATFVTKLRDLRRLLRQAGGSDDVAPKTAAGNEVAIGWNRESYWSLSPDQALEQLKLLKPATKVLDGLPEDYSTSGILETDCVFSRFGQKGTVDYEG